MTGRVALGRSTLAETVMPLSSLLYTAELDLAEPDIKPFLDWYAYRHAPDLVPLGFESSACYGTTGGDMNLFDIYEIPNRDLFYRRVPADERTRQLCCADLGKTSQQGAHDLSPASC